MPKAEDHFFPECSAYLDRISALTSQAVQSNTLEYLAQSHFNQQGDPYLSEDALITLTEKQRSTRRLPRLSDGPPGYRYLAASLN